MISDEQRASAFPADELPFFEFIMAWKAIGEFEAMSHTDQQRVLLAIEIQEE